MNPILKYTICTQLLFLIVFTSCKKESSCEDCATKNNKPPILWTKISGPSSFTIVKPTDSLSKLKTLVVGIYEFELTVTDNDGLSAKDTMTVIVDPVLTINHPPIANAGADQTIILPTNTVSLKEGSPCYTPSSNQVWRLDF